MKNGSEKSGRSFSNFIFDSSSLIPRLRRALRGRVSLRDVLLEAVRRGRVRLVQRRERAALKHQAGRGVAARLSAEFEKKSATGLLEHFRTRATPKFMPGFDAADDATARLQRERCGAETARLVEDARVMADARRWSLLGCGEQDFGTEIEWRRDPLSGELWPLDYHADVRLVRGDGSDVRVLWELNRLGHFITLGRAYALTGDARFAHEFFTQLESWREQNPTGRGPNWACAMEVALRAMNLLAAFQLFRGAPGLTDARLAALLAMFDAHGAHIRRHLEFSYIATSNHYLSDIVGLLWLGVCLPELRAAREWREFALGELLGEMDKQTLADGANGEASTGYHRFVLELFLYSFILCRANAIEIDERHWQKLRAMLAYVRAYLRPDGRAPLIGDTDGGQALPVTKRAADEHAYVLGIGAALFDEARFKVEDHVSEELLWLLGEDGVRAFDALDGGDAPASQAFADAGTYIMREGDLYLLFNASGAGLGGRGSHAHNDALSVEVAACGSSFIIDPGTYVYTSDFDERHLFRSTARHSTVEVDRAEQNTTDAQTPFVIGDEARPRVLRWESETERDFVLAEHDGYAKLPAGGITHRRAVMFDKRARLWLIEDALLGVGEHAFRFRFHVAPEMDVVIWSASSVEIRDRMTGARLLVVALDARGGATLEPAFASRDYGAKEATQTVCWTINAPAPVVAAWALVPVGVDDDEDERLAALARLKSETRGQGSDAR